jgi:FtsP/CotA-like multicopper oxidase with cupredoxin domain
MMTFRGLRARLYIALASVALWGVQPVAGGAAELIEPPVFSSSNGVLDLVLIAKPQSITSLDFVKPGGGMIHPTGWVYEICYRSAGRQDCPASPQTVSSYGGVRLALQAGDTLKIHLVNRLPAIDPAKLTHASEAGQANLALNPTNLHTHGMLVPARAPTVGDPTFGDYVFVSLFNRSNGLPAPQGTHQHGSVVMDAVDYRIDIPKNHPSGLFWFHPHIHGLSLNQVSAGLSGIITVGNVGDYAHGDAAGQPFPEASVRYLILKDMQVTAAGTVQFDGGPADVKDGEVMNQEDPGFCAQLPASSAEMRQGACPGADNSGDDGSNFTGGKWYFTVNGQQYPTMRISDPDGEIWRLTNASGSVSYNLQLQNDGDHTPMVMQLLAVDGTSVSLPQDTPAGQVVKLGGGRFRVVACPPALALHSLPVCVDQIVMMPSARAEVWVTHRDAGRQVAPSSGASATLKMTGLTMGSGDAWPAVDLAKVVFAQTGPRRLIGSNVDIVAPAADQAGSILSAPNQAAAAAPKSADASCKALPPGHRRRIFFGFEDVAVENSFALGYEELDQHGAAVPGTELPMTRFDPTKSIVCLPLGPGQTPVNETWELVQLSTENHNFHIHQSRFRVEDATSRGSGGGSGRPGILQDNVPLGIAIPRIAAVMDSQNGVCTPDQWRNGQCLSTPVVVDVAFSQIGEFVYHCHILEHEDGGMMARIRVVPAAN